MPDNPINISVDHPKITIAGAGISGLTAGIILAKHGYRVNIFEQGKTCGERFHGDFQGIENWSSRENILDFLSNIGLSTDFTYTPMNDLEFWTGSHRKKIRGEKTAFYIVRRGTKSDTLDTALFNQARTLTNLQIEFDHQITDFTDIDIIATGPVTRDAYTDALAGGYKFETDHPDFAAIIFDDNYAPDGYGYCIINRGEGVITTVAFKNLAQVHIYRDRLKQLAEKNLGISVRPSGIYTGIGNFFFGKRPADGKIYIGEANGLQDMLWGFGMRYAFTSGYLAAKSIIDSSDYYSLINKELNPMLRKSVVNRFLFAPLSNLMYKSLIHFWSLSSKPVALLGKIYRPDVCGNFLFPIANEMLRHHTRDPRTT